MLILFSKLEVNLNFTDTKTINRNKIRHQVVNRSIILLQYAQKVILIYSKLQFQLINHPIFLNVVTVYTTLLANSDS